MLHLILLQVNIGSHSKRGFAKRTLYTEASRQFQRCHQRAALSHEKKKKKKAMKLCYVTSTCILKNCTTLSLQQRTLHEDIRKTRDKFVTNCRGKSKGSVETALSPVKMITFFYFFPLQFKLKYLIIELKCLKHKFLHLWENKQAISSKFRVAYLHSTWTLQPKTDQQS